MRRKAKPKPDKNPAANSRPARNQATADLASVRIIGGTLRGRRIDYRGDPRTRPMKDRVREAVFNLLGNVSGRAAIDLFAGTGALGFEALSRGATAAVFYEQHFPTANAIEKNAAVLGVDDRCQVVAADTLVHFRRGVRLPPLFGDLPWIVLCSPPFDLYLSRRDEMLRLISDLWQAAPPESAFAVETDDRFDFTLLAALSEWDVRHYPPARVGIAWKDTPFSSGSAVSGSSPPPDRGV